MGKRNCAGRARQDLRQRVLAIRGSRPRSRSYHRRPAKPARHAAIVHQPGPRRNLHGQGGSRDAASTISAVGGRRRKNFLFQRRRGGDPGYTRENAGKSPLPFLKPMIYPLMGTPFFRDIVDGSNGAYHAGSGYDMVTGIGVPSTKDLMAKLAEAASIAAAAMPTRKSRQRAA